MSAMLMTNLDRMAIGPCPSSETPAQVGSMGYAKKSKHECVAFKAQILRNYPIPEDARAGVSIVLNPHELGSYREVELAFSDEEGENWAFEVQSDPKAALVKWDDESIAYLAKLP